MAMIRRSAQEQLQLIRECRASGLTISEWCRREGINPDTYYSWVDRQTKKGRIEKSATIPEVLTHGADYPEIVKVEITPPENCKANSLQRERRAQEKDISSPTAYTEGVASRSAVMEVALGQIRIKVTNQVDPQLLAQTLHLLGGGLGC